MILLADNTGVGLSAGTSASLKTVMNDALTGISSGGKINPFASDLTLGGIISALLPYTFYFAGLILFIYLIIGGFGFLTSAGNPDKTKAAQGKITTALIGFIIVFASFWLIQLVEVVFGISILK